MANTRLNVVWDCSTHQKFEQVRGRLHHMIIICPICLKRTLVRKRQG